MMTIMAPVSLFIHNMVRSLNLLRKWLSSHVTANQ